MSLFEAHNIQCQFPKEKTALFFIPNLQIEAHDRIVLQGRSGSGKSKLLRTLVGLEPFGKADRFYEGTHLTDTDWVSLRTHVLLVPQKTTLGHARIWDSILHPFSFKAHADKKDETRLKMDASQLLEQVSLSPKILDRDTHTLSGGETQTIALLRALLLKPKILLLDESLSAMDPHMRSLILEHWLQPSSIALVLIEHGTQSFEKTWNMHTLQERANAHAPS